MRKLLSWIGDCAREVAAPARSSGGGQRRGGPRAREHARRLPRRPGPRCGHRRAVAGGGAPGHRGRATRAGAGRPGRDGAPRAGRATRPAVDLEEGDELLEGLRLRRHLLRGGGELLRRRRVALGDLVHARHRLVDLGHSRGPARRRRRHLLHEVRGLADRGHELARTSPERSASDTARRGSDPMSLAADWLFSASLRTSSATTAKPRPCSPARAASMAAFRARRFVW
jgi:hypothetical protein